RSEASSGDIQRAEAGAAPAGGVTNRTRATAGHYDPDDVGAAAVSAARRVPRSQGARGRLANVLRRVSHTRQSAAYRTAARPPCVSRSPAQTRAGPPTRARPVALGPPSLVGGGGFCCCVLGGGGGTPPPPPPPRGGGGGGRPGGGGGGGGGGGAAASLRLWT